METPLVFSPYGDLEMGEWGDWARNKLRVCSMEKVVCRKMRDW